MMLTRCPACQTVFRLRAEQLRARHGEVRCGHCFNPFNALDHLIADESPAVPALTPASPSTATPPPVPASVAPATTDPVPAAALSAQAWTPTDAHDPRIAPPAIDAAPPAPPPVAPPVAPPSEQPGLLSELDFDIPDDIMDRSGQQLAGRTAASPPSHAERREPSLDEIDFTTFFEPDINALQPEAEAAPERPRSGSGLAAFPLLEPLADDTPATGAVMPGTPDRTAPEAPSWLDDDPERRGGAVFPEVIRAERRGTPDAGPESQSGGTEPYLAAPDREAARPAPGLHGADNEVDTDFEMDLAPITAPEVDTEYLDATYGKLPQASALKRTLQGLALGVLAGTLAMQATYLFRQDIARTLPGLRPLLVSACARLGCDLPLPREAALIAIETSDLQSEPGRSNRFILHATVRNRADFLQAWPHLELTLTDGADTPIARRVLAPAEWVAAGRLDAGFAARGDAVVRQVFEVTDLAPTGYRVYVFYP